MSKTKRETKRIDKRKVFEWDDEKPSDEIEERDERNELPKAKPKRNSGAPYDPATYNPSDYYSLRDMAIFDAYGTIKPSQRRDWDSKK